MARSVKLVKDLRPEDFQELCNRLLEADPDIRDIVLIGSAAYAPQAARELDLVITSRKKKDFGTYMDAAADFPINVDVIPREVGAPTGGLTWGIATQGRVFYGEGETIREAMDQTEEPPTFMFGRMLLEIADDAHDRACGEIDPVSRRLAHADAFEKLFHAARHAVMAYLHTEQTRWGQLKRELPGPFYDEFDEIVNTLHIAYAYNYGYPKDRADEEYRTWRDFVTRFVDELEKAAAEGPSEFAKGE